MMVVFFQGWLGDCFSRHLVGCWKGRKLKFTPSKKNKGMIEIGEFFGAVNPGVGSRDVKFHDVFFCDSLIGARVDQLTLFPYNRGWSSTH